jgi:hypothetical protein
VGDTVLAVWRDPARLSRGRFVFDKVRECIARNPQGILVCQIVLRTSTPPDAPARAEIGQTVRELQANMRRVVTLPVGDAMWMSLVRTMMRGMFMLSGQSKRHLVAGDVGEAVAQLQEVRGPQTPDRGQMLDVVAQLYGLLGVKQDR